MVKAIAAVEGLLLWSTYASLEPQSLNDRPARPARVLLEQPASSEWRMRRTPARVSLSRLPDAPASLWHIDSLPNLYGQTPPTSPSIGGRRLAWASPATGDEIAKFWSKGGSQRLAALDLPWNVVVPHVAHPTRRWDENV